MNGAEKLRSEFPILADGEHYLDSAATALMPRAVLEATAKYDAATRANVARGVHRWAEQATAAYENARREIADALGTSADEIVFTGGATAGLNLLAHSLTSNFQPDDAVMLTTAEHHSNIAPWQLAAKAKGFALHFAQCDSAGRLDFDSVRRIISGGKIRAASIVHASNVSGAISDIAAVAQLMHEGGGGYVIVDGAQYVPHSLPNLSALGADFYVFSGHKCFAPNGVGVLWGRAELLSQLPPYMSGGGMVTVVNENESGFVSPPQRFEAGTPPITPAIGLAAAIRWMRGQNWQAARENMMSLTKQLIDGLADIKGVHILGPTGLNMRAPIVSFSADGVHPHDICQILSERGVAIRGGHHCAQLMMRHFGVGGCARASIGPYNNEGDISALLSGLAEAIKILR